MMLFCMKNGWILSLLAAGLAAVPALGQDAEQLMERARIAATLQQTDLHGEISKGRTKLSIALFLRGENIQFTTGQGEERFHMRLGDDQFDLFEIVGGKQRTFPSARLSESIAGTDLTYEDLAFRFLYWPNPSLEGDEFVSRNDCWKIRVNNPGRKGAYAVIYVWIHKKSGAFMKIEGFDRSGKRLKRFEVREVQKVGDGYTLKEMDVSTMNGDRTASRSRLSFDRPRQVMPGQR